MNSPLCRSDGRCQYAIDSGAEGMGHCPKGECCMPDYEGIGREWCANSSLEKWFPFTADELTSLKTERIKLRSAIEGLNEQIHLLRETNRAAQLKRKEAEHRAEQAERALSAARAQERERAAITVWSWAMDWCRKNRINPADRNDLFEPCAAIRALGEPEGAGNG